jgi:hypothetical protein
MADDSYRFTAATQVLIARYLDGETTPSETADLSVALARDPELRQLLVDVAVQRVSLRKLYTREIEAHLPPGPSSWIDLDEPAAPPTSNDAMIVPALSPEEPAQNVPKDRSPWRSGELAARVQHHPATLWKKLLRPRSLLALAAAIVIAAAGLALALFAQGHASHATIAAASNAQFDDPRLSCLPGGKLPSQRSLNLTRGYLDLTLSGGADVVIEAPATFAIDSGTAVTLETGKISVTAAGRAHGFSVKTPDAMVTDLGTEFGVFADPSGATRVDVFSGQVQVNAADQSASAAHQQLVMTGQSVQVTAGVMTVDKQGASPQFFVRGFKAETGALDLADLLSGGDGTTRRSVSIDPGIGELGDIPRRDSTSRRGMFYAVPAIPVLAGVFIPDGPTAIDGSGRRFAFPNTNGDYGMLWIADRMRFDKNRLPGLMLFNGINYLDDDHRHIWLHPNNGVTIDLQAVHRLHPLMKLSYFHCVAGNCVPRSLIAGRKNGPPKADFYVIVDGVLRFERLHFTPDDGGFAVDVPLSQEERSLTFASTDGGDGADRDYVVMADALLN